MIELKIRVCFQFINMIMKKKTHSEILALAKYFFNDQPYPTSHFPLPNRMDLQVIPIKVTHSTLVIWVEHKTDYYTFTCCVYSTFAYRKLQ